MTSSSPSDLSPVPAPENASSAFSQSRNAAKQDPSETTLKQVRATLRPFPAVDEAIVQDWQARGGSGAWLRSDRVAMVDALVAAEDRLEASGARVGGSRPRDLARTAVRDVRRRLEAQVWP